MGHPLRSIRTGSGSFDAVGEAYAFIATELGGEYLTVRVAVAARLLGRSYQLLRNIARKGKFAPAGRVASTPRALWTVNVDPLARWLEGADIEPLPPEIPQALAADAARHRCCGQRDLEVARLELLVLHRLIKHKTPKRPKVRVVTRKTTKAAA